MLGDGAVGKTSIRKRHMGEGFSYDYLSTLGSDFSVKRYGEKNDIVVQIWDLAGQPRFSSVREVYYLGTKGVVLVYDVTRPETFYSIPSWINEAITHRNSTVPLSIALVANKIDLRNDEEYQTVTSTQGSEYATELANWSKMGVPYIETSAKTGFNVDMMFNSMIESMTHVNTLMKKSE